MLRQIDLATNATLQELYVGLSGPFPMTYTPQEVKLSPDGRRAYVANASNGSMSVINNDLHEVAAVVAVGNNPDAISVAPDDSVIYVANRGSNTVSVIDGGSLRVTATAAGFAEPSALSAAVVPTQEIFTDGFE